MTKTGKGEAEKIAAVYLSPRRYNLHGGLIRVMSMTCKCKQRVIWSSLSLSYTHKVQTWFGGSRKRIAESFRLKNSHLLLLE